MNKKSVLAQGRVWVLALGLTAVAAAVQAQTAQWSTTSDGVTGVASALDATNNVYATGNTAAGGLVLTKVGPTGAVAWQSAPVANGRSLGVSVDTSGNVLQVGMLLNANQIPVTAVVQKFSSTGALLWQNQTTAAYALAWRAAADAAGNVYVMSRQTKASGVGDEAVLTKYDPAGAVQWTRSFGGRAMSMQPMAVLADGRTVVAAMSEVQGTAVVQSFDANGNTIGAWSTASDANPVVATGANGETYMLGSSSAAFVATKLDAAFNGVWSLAIPESGAVRRAAVDKGGNLVIVGAVSTTASGGFGTGTPTSDWRTVKVSPNGAVLWAQTYGSATGDDLPNAVDLAADGSVQVAGQGSIDVVDPVAGTMTRPSTATVRYDATGGQLLWESSTTASTQGLGVQVGTDGATYLMGSGLVELGQPAQTVSRFAPPAVNQAPVAMASVSSSAGTVPLTVTFSSAGSADADGQIASYAWEFGDGAVSYEANPTYTYTTAGKYTARLIVTDNLGLTGTSAAITVTANAVVTPPPATGPAVPTGITLPATVVGGNSVTATVNLSTTNGGRVYLYSGKPRTATVPSSIRVAAGSTSGSFTVRSYTVRSNTVVPIYAVLNGKTVVANITVTPR